MRAGATGKAAGADTLLADALNVTGYRFPWRPRPVAGVTEGPYGLIPYLEKLATAWALLPKR